jgi:hypothetical protein
MDFPKRPDVKASGDSDIPLEPFFSAFIERVNQKLIIHKQEGELWEKSGYVFWCPFSLLCFGFGVSSLQHYQKPLSAKANY